MLGRIRHRAVCRWPQFLTAPLGLVAHKSGTQPRRLQGTPMTGFAQDEVTWSGRTGGGEVVDRDLIAPFAMMMAAKWDCRLAGRQERNDFIVSEGIAIA